MGVKLGLPLCLWEVHGLKAFEKKVLRRLFEPQRDVVTGFQGTLCYDDLHKLYSDGFFLNLVRSSC
jgi:hypothetical protein